jgi:hypothetical protein
MNKVLLLSIAAFILITGCNNKNEEDVVSNPAWCSNHWGEVSNPQNLSYVI